MTAYTIDHNVPMPGAEGPKPRRGRPPIYPFHQLGLGDSFFVPIEDRSVESMQSSADSASSRFKKRRFATRQLYDERTAEVAGTRVWRIA